jgi:hypothetical protein
MGIETVSIEDSAPKISEATILQIEAALTAGHNLEALARYYGETAINRVLAGPYFERDVTPGSDLDGQEKVAE